MKKESNDYARAKDKFLETRISQLSIGDIILWSGDGYQIHNVLIENEMGQKKAPLDKSEPEDKVTLTMSIKYPDNRRTGETIDLTLHRMVRTRTENTMLVYVGQKC